MSLADILSRSGAAGKGLPKRFQPFLAQALNEAAVRYSPQYDALNQLRQQSADTMRQSISQAQAAGQLNAALALEAHKAIAGDNSTAIQQALAYQQAPPGSSTQRVGLGISLGHDATGNILAQSAADAPIVAAQQGLQARALHQQDLQKIQGQRDSILGQVGNYVTGREGDLVTADRKQRATLNQNLRTIRAAQSRADTAASTARRGQDLSHQDRQAAIQQRKDAAAGKGTGKLPGGVKLNTPQQHGALKDSVGAALAVVQQQKALGRTRHEISQTLISGRPAQTITLNPGDPGYNASNPAANKVKVPALPKVGQLALSVALDQAFDQHVSGHNVNELHRRGYSVKTLGFSTTPPPAKPKRPAPKVSGPLGPAGPAAA